jgi:hypothetical protein
MRTKLFALLILASILLAGCASETTPAPTTDSHSNRGASGCDRSPVVAMKNCLQQPDLKIYLLTIPRYHYMAQKRY